MTKALINRIKEYKPSKAYAVLFIFFAIMFAWRFSGVAWFSPVSSHLSNFAITGLAMLCLVGPKDFKAESEKNKLIGIVCFFIAINALAELVNIGNLNISSQITFESFNTADLTDTVFGILAAIIVWAGYYNFTLAKRDEADKNKVSQA